MLISVLGGAIGLWIAQAASPFLLALLPIPIPLAFKVDWILCLAPVPRVSRWWC